MGELLGRRETRGLTVVKKRQLEYLEEVAGLNLQHMIVQLMRPDAGESNLETVERRSILLLSHAVSMVG